MKSIFFSIFFISLICISCGSSSDSSSNTYQDPHSKMHQEMHNELYMEQGMSKLDGQWLNKQVNDIEVDSTQYDGKQPLMIIYTKKEKITVKNGCNSFQQNFTVKK